MSVDDLNHRRCIERLSITDLNYRRCIERLRKELEVKSDGLNFLFEVERVISWIESQTQYAHNTRKMFYIAIVATIKNDNFPNNIISQYRDCMDNYNQRQQEIYNEQQLSKSEEGKYLDWPSVLDVRDKIYDSIQDIYDFQDYLIVCLYTMQAPMRLDYADMRVVKSEPETIAGNYLVVCDKPYFIFSEYKTANRYGTIRMPICKSLMAVIQEWLGYLVDSEYLLVNRDLQPMSAPSLGGRVISIFEKYCQKKVGIAILRHSYITYKTKGQKTIKESLKLASAMGHSVGIQQIYRKV